MDFGIRLIPAFCYGIRALISNGCEDRLIARILTGFTWDAGTSC